MSQAHLNATRRVLEAEINAGQIGHRFDAFFDPKVAFRDELGTLNDRNDLRSYIQGFQDTFNGFRVEIEEVHDHGDTIMLVVDQTGEGEASGVGVGQRFTWVLSFADDRCVRFEIYADHNEALDAAGLSD